MASTDNEYELERQERIAQNKRRLQEMGVLDAKNDFERAVKACTKVSARVQRKPKTEVPEGEIRRSSRPRPEVNYREEAGTFSEKISQAKGQRRVVHLDRSDVDMSMFTCPKFTSGIDSGKGVRIQGGRVYDSKLGVTCHWCRQKTLENKVTCTSESCGGGRRLPTSFCKMCLKNRHGEDVHEAAASNKWVCPCCRVSCGEGCQLCCNCGPCRKKAGLAPTHQLIKLARDNGFSNVHDFLVHQSTGLDAESIEARKRIAPWGQWLLADAQVAMPPPDDSATNGADESVEKALSTDAEVPAATQQVLTDTLRAVKGPQRLDKDSKGSKATMAPDRKVSRKTQILRSMGLTSALAQPLLTCA